MAVVDPRYHDPLLGVVFDLDGTLVLSHHAFDKMRHEVVRLAEAHGVMPGKLSITQTIPVLMELAAGELERNGAPEGSRFRFEAEVNHRIDEIELDALPTTVVRPGAPELLDALLAKGHRIGVLTRSSATFAEAALKKAGLRAKVRQMRTRSDSGPVKPDPEALLLLLRELEVPADRAVFVGDHLLDAECAHRANVRFYAVLSTSPSTLGTEIERFQAAGATAVAPDLDTLARQLGVVPQPAT